MTDVELSTRPRAARTRLRRSARSKKKAEDKIDRDIAILYKPVAEWDWEELSRGRPRSENGKFVGAKPKWIDATIQKEIERRMVKMTEDEVMSHARDAIQTLSQLMVDTDTDITGKPVVSAQVRADCAKYILNRVLGTPTTKHEVTGDPAYVALMGKIMVNPDGDDAHPVIEGEVVEDEEPEEEGP